VVGVDGVATPDRRCEPVGFALETLRIVREIEELGEEVLWCRVLVEPTHEIGECGGEVIVLDHRCVQEQSTSIVANHLDCEGAIPSSISMPMRTRRPSATISARRPSAHATSNRL
jgi:hypothetical protein